MYRRYLGISAVALAGLMTLAANAPAQEQREGSGLQREGASAAPQQQGTKAAPQREGSATQQSTEGEVRQEGEARSGGYYYGPYGAQGIYGPGYRFIRGQRYYYRYGYPGYYGDGYAYGFGEPTAYGDSYYDDGGNGGRRGRLFGGRRGGWSGYTYGAYSYGSGCYGSYGCTGGCRGGYYGSGCTGGYYGSGCSGSRGYYGAPANANGYAYGSLGNSALIDVKAPPDATITFDDQPTQQTGEMRQFITPPLDPSKNFSYMVHAKWRQGDKDMDENRKVTVHAGQQTKLDLTSKQSGEAGPEPVPPPARQPLGAREGAKAPPPLPEGRVGQAPQVNPPQANAPLANGDMHEGQFISFKDGTLEMSDQQGKHSHHLSPDTQIIIDGKPAKPEDLKADMKIKVSTKKGDPQTVTRIEAKTKAQQPGEKRAPEVAPPPAQPQSKL